MPQADRPSGTPPSRDPQRSLVLGISGASGLIYAVRALKHLLTADYTVDVVASKATYRVWQNEMGIAMPPDPVKQAVFWRDQAGVSEGGTLTCHRWDDVGATIASGSYRTAGMLVMPCSMSTVAKLATGLSAGLLERAADVHLKERRSLVIVPRETPLSTIHLRNLTNLSEVGVRVVPAIPAWYHHPQSIEDLVDFVVARALDQFEIDCVPLKRWDGGIRKETSPSGTTNAEGKSNQNNQHQKGETGAFNDVNSSSVNANGVSAAI